MKYFLLPILYLLSQAAFSQSKYSSISGTIFDTSSNKGLAYATVSIVSAKDSTLEAFTRADSAGYFTFRKMNTGKYILSASYVGFGTIWLPFSTKEGEETALGKIILTNSKYLAEVTVTTKRPPVTINNDTLEFNTENFHTPPNAVVEDLLKKLPGVVIEPNGTVKVNGQTVRRVLVDGKEFFTGDPKMATQNLEASAVDKVQVFDRKSDRSQFTGFDDGSAEKAINLKLKKDRKNATFGRVTAGSNAKDRFDAQTNINRFNSERQMSVIGMGNNTNRQGFEMMDVMSFTGELNKGVRNGGGVSIKVNDGSDESGLPITGLGMNQQGIAETYAGGLNYNDNFNKVTDLNSSVLFSDINLQANKNIARQTFLPDGSKNIYASEGTNQKQSKQQRINVAIDQKIDTFTSFKITPQITFQQNKTFSENTYFTYDSKNIKLNEGSNNTFSSSSAFNVNSTALFRRRFATKGRTISATITNGYNSSKMDGSQISRNTFFISGNTPIDSILNQQNNKDAVNRNFGSLLTYTEPLWKRSLLEISGFYNVSSGESNRKTMDYNNRSRKFDKVNKTLTNNFSNQFMYTGGTFNIRSIFSNFNLTFGTTLQTAQLKSINNSVGSTIKQSFTDVLPTFNVQYKMSQTRQVSINYNTSTQSPTTLQLQPIADVSNPLNIVYGNPDLKRNYLHSVTLSFLNINLFNQQNIFAFISSGFTKNGIAYADSIFSNGLKISRPVNVDGNYFVFGNINYGKGIKKLKSRIDAGLSINSFRNIGFINGEKNVVTNNSFSPSLTYTYTIDNKIDVIARAKLSLSSAKNSVQQALNNHFTQTVYGVEMTNYLPWGITLNNKMDYTINAGRADGFNTSIPLWSASIAKSFLKNKRAECKFSTLDILNRNTGINRTANQNFIEDVSYNVLKRYFLLSFTYSLNKAGKSNSFKIISSMSGNN